MKKEKVINSPVLEVKKLTLNIGTTRILNEVNLTIRQGDFLSVIGPNGAGKTTLLRCMVGVATGWTGDISVNGYPIKSYRRRHLARLVSYVPQSDEIQFPFTAREIVMMGRYPYLSPFSRLAASDIDFVDHILDITGTASIADRDLRTLSGGERQKIFIAGALAQDAPTMLLDEPTTFLDPRQTEEILSILSDLNRSGVTIVMVTHDINYAVHYAESVTALVSGCVAFNGPSHDLMRNGLLRSVYGKEFTLVKHPSTGRMMTLPGESRP